MGDALAVASDWTTPPAAEEPAQASPWTTAGTEQEEYMHEFVEKFVEKTPVVMEEVAAPVVQGEVEQKEGAHQAPSRSWPSKLSAFPRSVSSDVSAPRDVAGMTMSDKA
ncbi:hypothetical protein PF011_g10940 [Phytophthora fragariae]|uniref:Uncharacterized protein n=1 Tax=Phytophthora fragariae TaxID=53985 RepID=A0A6A3KLU4_9STRA|nr:hypothetical protein PF011_g10940 [Phytophthora fragariae]